MGLQLITTFLEVVLTKHIQHIEIKEKCLINDVSLLNEKQWEWDKNNY